MGIIDYSRTSEMVEIIVHDSTGRKIETHVCSVRDKKKYASILNYLKDKYGFEPSVDLKDVPQIKSKEDKLDWW